MNAMRLIEQTDCTSNIQIEMNSNRLPAESFLDARIEQFAGYIHWSLQHQLAIGLFGKSSLRQYEKNAK